jgi:2-dehydropantoate 2-reductase
VLCAVKAWQLPDALRATPLLLGKDSVVLPLQNGVEAVDQAAKALGRERVLGGAAWIRAEIAAPGLVRHSGIEPRIVLGEPRGGPSVRARDLAAVLAQAGIEAEATGDIDGVLWSKLVFISATSAVGAVVRVPIDAFRSQVETRALLVGAMKETMAVAKARGVALAPDVLERTLAFVDSLPAGTTSSMQRDVMAGRPSELEAQCGAVVRLGREARVPTAVNDVLYAALLPQERAARQAAGIA